MRGPASGSSVTVRGLVRRCQFEQLLGSLLARQLDLVRVDMRTQRVLTVQSARKACSTEPRVFTDRAVHAAARCFRALARSSSTSKPRCTRTWLPHTSSTTRPASNGCTQAGGFWTIPVGGVAASGRSTMGTSLIVWPGRACLRASPALHFNEPGLQSNR